MHEPASLTDILQISAAMLLALSPAIACFIWAMIHH
jgi:hypothetical protein